MRRFTGSKYKNTKYHLDGITFMSKAEAAYYMVYLKPLLEQGLIDNLEFQPRIRCEIGGQKVCDYIADFRYFDRQEEGQHGQFGCQVVVEVKGYETDTYKLKKKLVEALYPAIKIKVVKASTLKREIGLLPKR